MCFTHLQVGGWLGAVVGKHWVVGSRQVEGAINDLCNQANLPQHLLFLYQRPFAWYKMVITMLVLCKTLVL